MSQETSVGNDFSDYVSFWDSDNNEYIVLPQIEPITNQSTSSDLYYQMMPCVKETSKYEGLISSSMNDHIHKTLSLLQESVRQSVCKDNKNSSEETSNNTNHTYTSLNPGIDRRQADVRKGLECLQYITEE